MTNKSLPLVLTVSLLAAFLWTGNPVVHAGPQPLGEKKDTFAVDSPGPGSQVNLGLPTSRRSFRAHIDSRCLLHCAELDIPSHFVVQNFSLQRLEAGENCHTGQSITTRSFRIEDGETGETIFRYAIYQGQDPVEWPVDLKDLVLEPGPYRLCVSGGRGAECILRYRIAERPGAVRKTRPPRSTVRKPPAPARPDAKTAARNEIIDAASLLVLELDGIEEEVDEIREVLPSVETAEAAAFIRGEIEKLRKKLRAASAAREKLKERAEEHGLDIDDLLGEDLRELESKPRNLLGDLSLMEDSVLRIERSLLEEDEESEEESRGEVVVRTTDVPDWMQEALNISKRTNLAIDFVKLRSEIQAKAKRNVPARTALYEHLFGEYVSCLVAAAQKKTSCKVSGRVLSVAVEPDKQRITYEYEITKACPERTYRDPGRGQTTFDMLEKWIRETCSR